MRSKIVTILGQDYQMAMTTEAMFRVMEELNMEHPTEIGEKIIKDYSRKGLEDLCKIAKIFCEEAKALMVYRGYDREDQSTIEEQRLSEQLRRMPLGELVAVKNSLIEVVNEGFKREVADEEVDEGLLELAKKEEAQ